MPQDSEMYRRTGSLHDQKSFGNSGSRNTQSNTQELDILAIDVPEARDQTREPQLASDNSESYEQKAFTDGKARINNAFEAEAEATADFLFEKREKALADDRPNEANNGTAKETAIEAIKKLKNDAMLWLTSHSKGLRRTFWVGLLCLYNIYLGFAISLTWFKVPSWCEGIKFLVLLTAVPYLCAFFKIVLRPYFLKPLSRLWGPCFDRLSKIQHLGRICWLALWSGILIFLVIDTQDNRYRLVSASGIVVLLFLGYIFSAHPRKVMWRQVQWGVMCQFLFGFLILRWEVGRNVFECLGDKVKTFLEFTDRGSSFVFGYLVKDQLDSVPPLPAVFAFKVLSTVIFFSFLVSIFYYYGLMQILVMNVGWLLQLTIGTTACESMNAAGNIFLGMTEAPLIIRPYLPKMTKSELHAVLTGGFATIAGSVMAAYIILGVNAGHLLSASVMSAPAALAFSKLFYPETEVSVTKAEDIEIGKPKETNVIEAASNGASNAIFLVSNIAANLVAFVAFIALLDSLISWFGSLVNWEFLSFEWLLSKAFVPLSLLMGVQWDDKERVASLVGLKTVINEFVAYGKLAEFRKQQLLSRRSEAIATFALCGFSNFSSIGIQLGALGAMAPERKSDLASLALRAMVAGSAACFMTACVAGTLLTDIG